MKYLLILFVIISFQLYPYELRLHFARANIYDNTLYANVYIGNDMNFYSNIKRYLDNGIITIFNFRVNLFKENLILDDSIKDAHFYRRMYYDFFTKEYAIYNSLTMAETRNTNFYELIRNTSQINRVEIINTTNLDVNSRYYFKTRLSIQFENAYPYLNAFFNMITPLQYRIKWLKSNNFYLNELS
ncbi:DUF4390 domain-containing protein [Brachyspira pilosicoli]|uniref:DUF4390 domain-containing protein n=1 Tax=Brachyspira pilosicoli TaxID=52584 RepID=A0A5C8EUU9_BRAPL|nr:DUF4390 domain-containing protein [Brachyspira pilosicoli]TXJ40741.1 DUF4390 domain-containing protein [Brachyspira pilosicoli]